MQRYVEPRAHRMMLGPVVVLATLAGMFLAGCGGVTQLPATPTTSLPSVAVSLRTVAPSASPTTAHIPSPTSTIAPTTTVGRTYPPTPARTPVRSPAPVELPRVRPPLASAFTTVFSYVPPLEGSATWLTPRAGQLGFFDAQSARAGAPAGVMVAARQRLGSTLARPTGGAQRSGHPRSSPLKTS